MTLVCKNPPCTNVRRKGYALCYNCDKACDRDARLVFIGALSTWRRDKTDENLTRLLVTFQAMVQSIK